MDKFKTTDLGGLPFKLDDNRWQDAGYRDAFKGIMSAFGVSDYQAVILSGCERTLVGGSVAIAEGYVSIAGEICLVPAHSYSIVAPNDQEYWVIEVSYDNSGNKNFQNNTNNDTYEIRIGRIQTGASVPVGFTPYQDTPSIYQLINDRVDTVPINCIMMWSGSPNAIPSGYSLCDGQNGTPDLRGRFVVGYDQRTSNPNNGYWDAQYNGVGNTGGEKNHTLTVGEMPAHQHDILLANTTGNVNDPGAIVVPNAVEGNSDFDPPDVTGAVSSNGGGGAHNNLPPYFVLAYIMKVSTSVVNAPGGLSGVSTGSN